MQSVFEQLCLSGQVSGAVDTAQVRNAQEDLNATFPAQYSAFLLNYGAALLKGAMIYGLPDRVLNNPPLWEDVVNVNKKLRGWGQDGTQNAGYVAISDDGAGVYFYLDTLASPETKIVAVGPGIFKTVAEDFYEFAVSLSNGTLSY